MLRIISIIGIILLSLVCLGFAVQINPVTYNAHFDCRGKAAGVYPDLSNCRRYVHCWKNGSYFFQCMDGFVFHPCRGRCVFGETCISPRCISPRVPQTFFSPWKRVRAPSNLQKFASAITPSHFVPDSAGGLPEAFPPFKSPISISQASTATSVITRPEAELTTGAPAESYEITTKKLSSTTEDEIALSLLKEEQAFKEAFEQAGIGINPTTPVTLATNAPTTTTEDLRRFLQTNAPTTTTAENLIGHFLRTDAPSTTTTENLIGRFLQTDAPMTTSTENLNGRFLGTNALTTTTVANLIGRFLQTDAPSTTTAANFIGRFLRTDAPTITPKDLIGRFLIFERENSVQHSNTEPVPTETFASIQAVLSPDSEPKTAITTTDLSTTTATNSSSTINYGHGTTQSRAMTGEEKSVNATGVVDESMGSPEIKTTLIVTQTKGFSEKPSKVRKASWSTSKNQSTLRRRCEPASAICHCPNALLSPDELRVACAGLACLNGGRYLKLSSGHCGCLCPAGFYGDSCQHLIDQSKCRCVNAGKCVQLSKKGYFACRCPLGYLGSRCQYKVEDIELPASSLVSIPAPAQLKYSFIDMKLWALCDTNLCVNGGVCLKNLDTNIRKCFCTDTFFGNHCEKFVEF